jgi:hypothetical protein
MRAVRVAPRQTCSKRELLMNFKFSDRQKGIWFYIVEERAIHIFETLQDFGDSQSQSEL